MSDPIRLTRAMRRPYARYDRAHSGQTLVVALAILLILLFIGAIFVQRVGRNLTDSARGRDVEDARALAEAGLKYCDNELNGSIDGADWRPVPSQPIGPNGGSNDPDYFWLQKGFTRLSLKGGRALVRVSYDPDPDNPVGQAIKIESIGRTGELDFTDPTVFVQNQTSPRLRRELIAYKRIGITDYLRFMTDKDKSSHNNYLGVPAIGHYFPMVYGNPMLAIQNPNDYTGGVANGETLYGGPIYCNSNLTIMGDAYFFEGPRGVDPGKQQEAISVAGVLTANQTSAASPTITRVGAGNQAFVNTDLTGLGAARPITPTYDATGAPNAAFSTYSGIVRDGSAASDASGYTRGVTYLNPPTIDSFVNGTGSLRVRQMTSQSGRWLNSSFNTGMHGWGTRVYIDNDADLQQETVTPGVNGAYTLPNDWTNPNAGFAQSGWQGPYYRPPGVLIELLGDRMRITRTDGKSFYSASGTANPQSNGNTLEIPFSDLDRTNLNVPTFSHDGDDPIISGTDPRNSGKFSIDPGSYGVNVLLFAEGNIRVKGVYGTLTDTTKPAPKFSRVHLTLITGGTAYIEGSLIKGDGTVAGAGAQPILQRNSTCQILAKDYVCVNTSMFMAPQHQTNVWNRVTPDVDAFATEIGMPRTSYDAAFANGVSPNTYTSGGNLINQMLLLRHAALAPGPTSVNLSINPVNDDGTGTSLFRWPYKGANTTSYPLGIGVDPVTNLVVPDTAATTPNFEQKTFDLIGNAAFYNPYPGYDNLLRFQVDQTATATQNNIGLNPLQSYMLSSLMAVPLDIRIEAAMYAQEKSFFIIPGYSFNPDPDDTRAHFNASNNRASFNLQLDNAADLAAKGKFPYNAEPLDARITICGAIAENYTADIGAQAAWLKAWGYTPAKFGSFNANNPAQTEIPDDHLMARDPAASAGLPVGYIAGDPGGLDFRTKLEKQTDAMPPANDFLLTRALRFEYDPVLAMPYFHSTDASPNTGLTGHSNRNTRLGRALRFIPRHITSFDGTTLINFRQILPPMPGLPVGPDLIYSGASESLVGEDPFDTDQYQ